MYNMKLQLMVAGIFVSTPDLHASIPLNHQLQLRLGVLDLVLGLHVQHVGRVFPVDLQDNVTWLQVCLLRLAAPVDLFNRIMSSS